MGMTGVSLRCRGRVPRAAGRPPSAADGFHTRAPVARAVGEPARVRRRYRAAGVDVDLNGLPLGTDDNDLPIHGLLVGQPGWRVLRCSAGQRPGQRSRPRTDVDAPAFPFAHRIEVTVAARERRLTLDTTLVPTGRRHRPRAFGWHPYLRLPGTPRATGTCCCRHVPTSRSDARHPSGGGAPVPGEAQPIGRRTFDDLYRLGHRHIALATDCRHDLPVRPGVGPGRSAVAALEPMTSPTNSLVDGTAPLVEPGDTFTAAFTIAVGEP